MRTLYTAASLALIASLSGCNRGQRQAEPEHRVVTTPQLTGTTASETGQQGPTIIAYAPPPRSTYTPPSEQKPAATTTAATTTAATAATYNMVPVPPLSASRTAMGAGMGMNSDAICTLRADMRKLWTEHAIWTRDNLNAVLDDTPEQKAAAARLKMNNGEIGDLFGTYFGKQTGDKITSLLNDHAQIGGDLARAVKDRDIALVKDATSRWNDNAEQIADALSSASPNFSKSTLSDMLSRHEKTAADEVEARLAKDYDKAAKLDNQFYEEILQMADALSDGIVKQFPQKFGGSGK
jgi:hypothetical protein